MFFCFESLIQCYLFIFVLNAICIVPASEFLYSVNCDLWLSSLCDLVEGIFLFAAPIFAVWEVKSFKWFLLWLITVPLWISDIFRVSWLVSIHLFPMSWEVSCFIFLGMDFRNPCDFQNVMCLLLIEEMNPQPLFVCRFRMLQLFV